MPLRGFPEEADGETLPAVTAGASSQLSLFLEEHAGDGAARGGLWQPVLLVVRSRGHFWSRRRTPGVVVWTLHELFDRVRLLGFLERRDNAVLDDDAALWASAAVLSRQSRFAVRVAPDLATLLSSLVHGGADARQIAAHLDGQDGRQGELAALFGQVQAVRSLLDEARVVDEGDALARGVTALESGRELLALRAFSRVVVENPVDPSELELKALLALSRAGVPLEVHLPRVEGHEGLAEGMHWIASAIEATWDAPALELHHEPLTGKGELRRFVDDWYRPSLAPSVSAPVRVEILADPFDEARRIAGVVARWRRGEGPPRIAVAVRTLDAQAERIVDALASHGVPARLSAGPTLADTPPGRLLLDLLRARRQGSPRELLLSVLGSPAFRHGLPPERVGSLARLLRRAVARTDVEDASRPEGGYRHRLERWANGRDDDEEAAEARAAADDVERVLAWARRLPVHAPLERHLAACLEVLEEACVDDEDGARDRVQEALERWSRSLERVAPRGTGEVDIAAIVRLLSRTLSNLRLPPPRVSDDTAVEVLTLPELFGREWDYVVLADLQHGRVPLAERADPLLADGDRALVNKSLGRRVLRLAEPDLLEPGVVPARQALEPLWFLGGMAAARRGLLLTAPGRDRRGRDVAPSEFLVEALLALGAPPEARAAGTPFDEEPHPRQVGVVLAHRVAQGEPVDESEIVDKDAWASARRLAEASRQRRRFFERPTGADPRPWVAPYAFAIDPRRVEERFGRDLGLDAEKPLGPTRLEALATCGMRGFVEHLLRLDTDPESGHDADARTLGKLAHAALEGFFRERRDQGVEPARMNAEDRGRLRAIVEECAAPYLEGGAATGHLGALRANVAWLAQSLVRTVSGLAQNPPVPGAVPKHFELKVGTRGWEKERDGLPPVPVEIGRRTLFLGGEIDRVDECAGKRVIVDYKHSTGRAVYKKLHYENLLTTHFQLPLYLRVLEQGAMTTSGETELLGYLVSLRDGVASPVLGEGGVLRTRLFDPAAATGFAQSVARVLDPIFDGAVAPDEGGHCHGCRLSRVCRVPLATERGIDDAVTEEATPEADSTLLEATAQAVEP